MKLWEWGGFTAWAYTKGEARAEFKRLLKRKLPKRATVRRVK